MEGRGQALRDSESLQHILYFKNNGTVARRLWFILTLKLWVYPLSRAMQKFDSKQISSGSQNIKSVFQQVVDEEMALRDTSSVRIVEQNGHFISFVPFAAISFHLYIMPLANVAHFEEASDQI